MRFDRRWMTCAIVPVLTAAFLFPDLAAAIAAGGRRSVPDHPLVGWTHKPYCGLYAIYAAAKLAGKEIDFGELVKPKYLNSRKGSTLTDLLRAAVDNGFQARVVHNLTINDLRRSPYRMILYVKATAESTEYNHYELLTEKVGDGARLLNPPISLEVVSFRELAPRWSGSALVLSTTPIDMTVFNRPRRSAMIACASACIAVVMAMRLFLRRLWTWAKDLLQSAVGASLGQIGLLGAAACLCGVLYHIGNEAGFLVLPDGVSACQRAHVTTFLPKIGVNRTRRLLGDGARVIDARMPEDYENGHLEGAVNIPVGTSREQCLEAMSGPLDSPIVVYCQSLKCPYAEEVAANLVAGGYSNIYIFKGGWREWMQSEARAGSDSAPKKS